MVIVSVFGTYTGSLRLHPSKKSLVSAISALQLSCVPRFIIDTSKDQLLAGRQRTVWACQPQHSPHPLLPDLDLQEVFHLSLRISVNLWNLRSRAPTLPWGLLQPKGCRNRAPSHSDSAFRNAEESPNKDTGHAVSTV